MELPAGGQACFGTLSPKLKSPVPKGAGASGRVVAAGLRGGPLVGEPGLVESGGLRYVFAACAKACVVSE